MGKLTKSAPRQDFQLETRLQGISTQILSGYLLGLGLMSVVERFADADAQFYWGKGYLVFRSSQSFESIVEAIAQNYRPRKISNPWNKGSGLKANSPVIEPFINSKAERWRSTAHSY